MSENSLIVILPAFGKKSAELWSASNKVWNAGLDPPN